MLFHTVQNPNQKAICSDQNYLNSLFILLDSYVETLSGVISAKNCHLNLFWEFHKLGKALKAYAFRIKQSKIKVLVGFCGLADFNEGWRDPFLCSNVCFLWGHSVYNDVVICYRGCSTKYSARICVLFEEIMQGCVVGAAFAVCAVPYL